MLRVDEEVRTKKLFLTINQVSTLKLSLDHGRRHYINLLKSAEENGLDDIANYWQEQIVCINALIKSIRQQVGM